jgi:diguanylate cyclase (GGDEF)-like protein
MLMRIPRRLAAPLALLCVLAGCKHTQERSVPLSEVVSASPSARGTRIQTTGIATYSDPEWRVLFVQDQGVGMYLTVPSDSAVSAGDRVQIAGNVSAPGRELEQSSVRVISKNNPLPVPVRVKDYSVLPEFFSQFVEISGVVRWAGIRNGRPTVELAAGKKELVVYFRQVFAQDLPAVGSDVTVAGVAAADFDSSGQFRGSKLFSPSAQQIRIVKLGPADPFSLPLKRLSELKDIPAGTLVHVTGEIGTGTAPFVSDGANVAPISFAESVPQVSGVSDISGFWTGAIVKNARARPMSHLFAKNGDIVHLAELKHLSVAAASAQRRVSVRAVVTYVDRAWGLLFVQDETAAAYVDFHNIDIHLQPGDLVDITGVSGAGGYAPQIDHPKIGFVRRVHLPEPLEMNLLQENMAAADSKWCRIRGVVHTAREQDGRTVLEIGVGPSHVSIQLPVVMHTEQLLDHEVSVTGVFGVLFNDRRQAIGHQIFVPTPPFLKVMDSGARQTDPVTIVSLQRYNPNTDERYSVAVAGTVVLKGDTSTVFVEDSTAGIQVRGDGSLRAADGDHVSVRGYVTNGEYSPVLEHGIIISRSPGQLPEPYSITAKSALQGHYDSEYVTIRATLAAVRSSPDGAILILNDNGTLFEALGPASEKLNSLRPSSELEIRGICRVQVDPTRHAVGGFNLAFDSPQSVSVLRMGPWWDTRKITWALFGIVLISALSSLWIVLLRRKVEVKTSELQSSVEAKRQAQRFDVARNQVLEAIARNAPPPESMERLALAVQEQIEGSVCAIAMSPDGKSFLDGKPSAVLIAPNLPEDLQRQMLPVLSSVLVNASEGAASPRNDTDVMASVLETARWSGMNFCDADVVVAFSGAGELAGLVMVFFQETPPADTDNATGVLQSASRLVSLARDHWYMHERLVFDARHDALTGLPNRTVAEDRLEQALARAHRRKQMFAILCIDLDGFKAVNDNLGHQAGDELLRVVATRLRGRIRHSDTLARIGGDEFLAIIEDCSGDLAAQSVGETLVATLQEPLNLEGKTVSISGSIGIAMYPTDGKHAAELKRNADQAMYRAKASSRGKICFWSGEPVATRKATLASSNLS